MAKEIIKYKHPLVFIIGPSGSGKDSIINIVKQKSNNISFPPTLTTREKRPHEKEGNYTFISLYKFKQLISENAFIEYDSHFDNFYGSSKELILNILNKGVAVKQTEINGMNKIINSKDLQYNKKDNTLLIDSKYLINIYFVGIIMESVEITKERILNRDGNIPSAQKRIDRMPQEYDFVKTNTDYCLINYFNKQEKCANEFIELIKKLDKQL